MPVRERDQTIPTILLNYIDGKSEKWNIELSNDFSKDKKLFDYQKNALENAIKTLYQFYEEYKGQKEDFAYIYQEYIDNLSPKINNKNLIDLLSEFYPIRDNTLPFKELSNRMSFWMATGSGKTLVIIKLIDLLFNLMEENLIPKKPIMFLTAREDLVNAFLKHLREFNHSNLDRQIQPIELKNYQEEKAQGNLFRKIFYYRSDLISDERGDKILDFREFLDKDLEGNYIGDWYIILDEAHKGDKQDSKRQFLVNILSKDGFLFNFSATFTDPIDIATTVYNLNLSEFIKIGYGKQIYLSQSEVKGFEKKEEEREFNEYEKKKIILKTLILLSALKKAKEKLPDLYHFPLAIYLVNSVNVEDSDLKLLFEELLNFAKSIDQNLFKEAKKELNEELKKGSYLLGNGTLEFMKEFIEGLKIEDIYKEVYNASSGGELEYEYYEGNNQEVALKHTSASKPFALIKIGSVSKIKSELLGNYRENKLFEDKKYFENLNSPDSPINILIGSRTFYEGWDSPRPNLIVFINLGKQTDAKKFVLQSIGRGIRIEPVKNIRQRLLWIKDYTNLSSNPEVKALESLFVFATSRSAVETILEELEKIKQLEEWETVEFYKNNNTANKKLLIPKYKSEERKVYNLKNPHKFRLSKENYTLLKLYFDLINYERFVMERDCSIQEFENLKCMMDNTSRYFTFDEKYHYRSFDRLMSSLLNYIRTPVEELDNENPFILLPEDAIVHFKEIKVKKAILGAFKKIVDDVFNAKEISEEEKFNLILEYGRQGKTFEEASDLVKSQSSLSQQIDEITLEKIMQHYYIPIAYSKNSNIVKHIINVESEIEFIQALKNKISKLDEISEYWFFSKLNENKDNIHIPYLDKTGKYRRYIPDFIFWFKLKDSDKYIIYFIDPKGTAHTDYELKVDGYEKLFVENGKPKIFNHEDIKIEVRLKLFNKNNGGIGDKYIDYWIDENKLFDDLWNLK